MAAPTSPNLRYVARCRKINESLKDTDVVLTLKRGLNIVPFLPDGENDMPPFPGYDLCSLRTYEIHFVCTALLIVFPMMTLAVFDNLQALIGMYSIASFHQTYA